MSPLITNVIENEAQVTLAKGNGAVARLPIQRFAAKRLVHVMSRCALKISDQIRDQHGRGNVYGHVNVSVSSTKSIEVNAICIANALGEHSMSARFDIAAQEGCASFGVPDQM